MSSSIYLRESGYCKCEGYETMWMSPQSESIITYALAGFANLQCIGIMIGGLSCMVPSRKERVSKLGSKCVTKNNFNLRTKSAMDLSVD